MMTSSRPRDVGGNFSSRRGHASQLSISDPSHHVTEAIGTMYGDDDDDSGSENRPLSFVASPYVAEQVNKRHKENDQHDDPRRLVRSTSDKSPMALATTTNGNHFNPSLKKAQTLPARIPSQRSASYENNPKSPMSPLSPTPSLRDVQADASGSQFPLTNIDNPNDIAQELSNLQALRRMSMDVGNTSDPDLLPFQGMSLIAMPSIAPTGDDDEADPSRLLWVPARVHPELEPTAFKNFLENRVQTMKRRSGDSMLSPDGLQRNNSGSLRRKKSMLSRQIENSSGSGADGYVDGAERLERKKSQGGGSAPELSLDELVKDPTKAVQKLAQESQRQDAGAENGMDDMPILPAAPGMGLRRSTRTTYRKGGSLRSGDRLPFSKRVAARSAEKEGDEASAPAPVEAPRGHGLVRVQSEPIAENYSRPTRSVRRQQNFSRDAVPAASQSQTDGYQLEEQDSPAAPSTSPLQQLPIRTASSHSSRSATSIPQIIETPPSEETAQPATPQVSRPFPQRSSSQKAGAQLFSQQPTIDEPPARSSKRPSLGRPLQTSPPSTSGIIEQPPAPVQGQTLSDMAQHPSPLPGSGTTRTDSLTFIPTLPAEEKKDKKAREKEDSDSKSSGWKWFKSDEKDKKKKEKEKEREREREKEEQSKKAKNKSFAEKAHDSARLDVLQTSIDTAFAKGRESLLLDRESIDNKLHEERKKESNRKSSDTKKERDGFFGSIFGGSRRKGDKDSASKKGHQRALSPEPPAQQLRPDIDYAWTRFTIIEERAIYRMAHIKLANPRRPLLSQVLLSNFMYSYLAKVQAMHPQLQVPVSPQQKRQEEERRRREQEEQAQQQQQSAQDEQYSFEYHRAGTQYDEVGSTQDGGGGVQYIDDAQIYEYDHGQGGAGSDSSAGQDDSGYHAHDGYGHVRPGGVGQESYYYGHHDGDENANHHGEEDDLDMW